MRVSVGWFPQPERPVAAGTVGAVCFSITFSVCGHLNACVEPRALLSLLGQMHAVILEKPSPLLTTGVLHNALPGSSSSRLLIPPASPPSHLFPSCHSDDNDLCCGHLLESSNVTIIF